MQNKKKNLERRIFLRRTHAYVYIEKKKQNPQIGFSASMHVCLSREKERERDWEKETKRSKTIFWKHYYYYTITRGHRRVFNVCWFVQREGQKILLRLSVELRLLLLFLFVFWNTFKFFLFFFKNQTDFILWVFTFNRIVQ